MRILLAVVVTAAMVAGCESGDHGKAVPLAPYFSVAADNPRALADAQAGTGLDAVTAAFVLGDGCTPIWDGGEPVADATDVNARLSKAQADGMDLIVSFGGEAGTDLSRSCPSVARLAKTYRSVLDQFHTDSIDFDVEGEALDDAPSINRRLAAIRSLEQAMPGVRVSVTLPVTPSGLAEEGVAFLTKADDVGTRIDLVNIMTMDYGTTIDMGAAAISAAKGTLVQLKRIWPSATYAMVGITPMVGVNDTTVEHFTLADAKDVATFAAQNHVGRLAFWALNRDRPCPHPSPEPLDDCSGLAQSPYAFTKALQAR